MTKFHIVIFGCQMNYADAARIRAVLTNIGMTHVDTIDEADIVVLDTCSVRQKSEDKVTGKIREIPSDKKIWITWCMVQHNLRHAKISKQLHDKTASELMKRGNFVGNVATRDPEIVGFSNQEMKDLKEYNADTDNIVFVNHAFNPMFFNFQKTFPNLELIMRIDDIGFIPRIASRLGYEVQEWDIELTNEYNDIIPHTWNQLSDANAKTAFVPVSTGCSQFCAYCIVPYARGLEKNLPADKIIAEARHHIENGVEEITLIGQIVNKHPNFADICEAILDIPGLRWLRYTSPYPTFYSDKLLHLHETHPKMCPHIHMPLQSGSDTILKKMFRGYTAEQFRVFVDRIRALNRDISITSDIIVGFCDETEEDFQESMALTQYARFDMVYIGIYSPRPGTLAHRMMDDNIPKDVKHDRRDRLNTLLKEISYANNQKEIGRTTDVMITAIHEDGTIDGYTDNMKNITIGAPLQREEPTKWEGISVGSFTTATITEGESFRLKGKLT